MEPERSVLLIHDMQQYFLNAFVPNQSPLTELVQNIQVLWERCTELEIPIVYTAQPGNQKQEDRALLTDFWGPGLADDESVTKRNPDLINRSSMTYQVLVFFTFSYFSSFKNSLF
nr:isochorismatase family protein [uncultured Bacillus sp.]